MLVPTGPLTNVALLLQRHPDVRDRLDRIVWMGGAIAEGNVTPAAEFNAFVDPEAAAAVFASGIDVTMIGLDVTHQALFTPAHAERLRGTGAAGRTVAELADFFLEFHRRLYRFDGAPIHDAVAVAHVIDPTLVETLRCNVEIETQSQHCDGRTVVDRWLVLDAPRNADVGIELDVGAVPRAAGGADRGAAVIVFAAIAPHGELDDVPELRAAMEELGRRFDAAAPETTVVVTPHNVHVEGHFAVVTAGRVGETATDRGLAPLLLDAFRADGIPALGVSYGGNDPAEAEMPVDWGTSVPLSFIGGRPDRRRQSRPRPAARRSTSAPARRSHGRRGRRASR